MIKTIVFDLGGVILDFNHKIISKKLSDISAKNEAEIFDFIFKSGLEKLYDTGKISSYEFYKKIIEHFSFTITYEYFSKIWQEIFSEKPEMAKFLDQLKGKNHNIVLLSNTNELHFDYCLSAFNVMKKFDECFLSYRLGMRKPDQCIFEEIMNRLGKNPEELLFIDDIEENTKSANRLKINTIQYLSHNYFLKRMEYYKII